MTRTVLTVLAALAVLALAACGGSGGSAGPDAAGESVESPSPSSSGTGDGSAGAAPGGLSVEDAAYRFLDTYVGGDGAVRRHDEGGDVVSEGQAYAMLIAQLTERTDQVATIWRWTKEHLQRPDGLLSWRADGQGNVTDRAAATDADTLAAYALLRYDGPDAAALQADGRRLAAAVLQHETVAGAGGLVPTAGDWAAAEQPPTVNPSYWMPDVARALARLTGDDRWEQVATTTLGLLQRGTGSGQQLPADWGSLSGDTVEPKKGGVSGAVQYGPDAQRVPVFLGFGCDPGGRELAAAWWGLLQDEERSGALALELDGEVTSEEPTPLALLASAAAAAAAGDEDAADDLHARAVEQALERPTYYGDAWIALAGGLRSRALLDC